jgi:hypothetical protein
MIWLIRWNKWRAELEQITQGGTASRVISTGPPHCNELNGWLAALMTNGNALNASGGVIFSTGVWCGAAARRGVAGAAARRGVALAGAAARRGVAGAAVRCGVAGAAARRGVAQ